jgi:iron(III) transport system ATP-binding protein
VGVVVLENVGKSYGEQPACTEINLDIQEGEFFTFLGPSGCGKTTILRLIAGFITPEKGSIFLGGKDITSLEPEKRDVGMVFQNYALFPFMTVRENIEYGLKIQKRPAGEIRKKTDHYLGMVGLEGYDHRQISELSGGEQQRVAFARSLAIEPQVLLLDEPLSNLDARLRDSMRAELSGLQKELGITTIFVTHDQTEALTMSDRLAVFSQGRCIQIGTPEQIYQQPANAFVAGFIGETNLFSLQPEGGQYFLENGREIRGVTG